MWGSTVKELRMACLAVNENFPLEDEVEVRVLIENVSTDKEIVLTENRPFLDYEVNVNRVGAEQVPMTDYGKDLRNPEIRPLFGSRKRVKITPDQPYIFRYPLYQYFNLKRLGEYEVTISRPDWKDEKGELKAPPFLFRVV